jgi:threonine-phosphate decarboxylase
VHGDFILKAAKELEMSPEEILDFASNINPFPPGDLEEVIIRAARKAQYYPENSYLELKGAVAEHLGCEKKEVVIGNGSIELIDAFFRLNKSDTVTTVMIPYPTFTEYERYALVYGFHILYLPCSSDVLTDNAADVSVMCNPNNPTGDLFNLKDFRASKPFLIDEAFIDFVENCEAPCEGENFIVRSLTKILAIPGLRFGYGRFPESFALKFERIRSPWHVNVVAMEVALHYLPDLNSFSRKVRKVIAKERSWLIQQLAKMRLECKGTANFLLVKAPFDAEELFKFLYTRGILIRTCRDFRGLGSGHFRIAVRSRPENEKLVESIREFTEFGEYEKL